MRRPYYTLMREPRDLEVAGLAMRLAVLTYQVTKGFPLDERFGLVAQMRRAAVSVGSNIVEGCGRGTDRAFVSFIENALGSVLELTYQAQIALRLDMGDATLLHELCAATDQLKRMLASLNASVRRRKSVAVPVRQRAAPAAP